MGAAAFPNAVAAGWPPLGGEDIHVEMVCGIVRGHFWQAPNSTEPPVIICPGFTEFCEKYSMVAERLVGNGHDVLIIDWPGQGGLVSSARTCWPCTVTVLRSISRPPRR